MYSNWRLALKYLGYWLSSSNGKGHGTHSPFIFHFITQVLNNKKHYPEYDRVEMLRSRLLKDKTLLTIEDFGAGSLVNKTNQRSIATIAKISAKPAKYGQLLFRIVKTYQPRTVLELGTSLGITSSYLSLAKTDAMLITMEGAAALAETAAGNIRDAGIGNCTVKQGHFDETLPAVVAGLPSLDFAFIDGNHRQEPTEKYFLELLRKVNNDSIIVLDDIHWSRDMEQAWETVKQHPEVRCSIDLFFMGVVFFRKEFREKQHYCIRF